MAELPKKSLLGDTPPAVLAHPEAKPGSAQIHWLSLSGAQWASKYLLLGKASQKENGGRDGNIDGGGRDIHFP